MPTTVTVSWPPASLSGHNNGGWRKKSSTIGRFRNEGWGATLSAKVPPQPDGDIPILVRFTPPDRRSDRTNFANRIKPIIDGIADAMKVNDRRFIPSYEYCEPEKPGRVEFIIGAS